MVANSNYLQTNTMNHKTISISTTFNAHPDTVWQLLLKIETLQYIAAPMLTFKSLGSDVLNWREGDIYRFRIKLFGLISLGEHGIKVMEVSPETLTIYTEENNRMVPVWNHTIRLKQTDDGKTHYTDIVALQAGKQTRMVALWGKLFYKHRQRKWQKLLVYKFSRSHIE